MDFRLSVFISVTRNLSFTKAAAELYISQPAISRHIKELEEYYKVQLFERVGSKIKLTAAGSIFLKHAESIVADYRALQLDMNLLADKFTGALHIGASTTIAQYILPPIAAQYIASFPEVKLSLTSGNTEQIEQALEEHKIDLGFIEGSHRKHSLKYTSFAQDELVLITNVQNQIEDEISLDRLQSLPLVLRESGSGTLEVIERALSKHGIKLSQMNILLQLGSTESIKLFLQNSLTVFAIVSIAAVSQELLNNKLKVVEVEGLQLNREFAIVINQGMHSNIQDHFLNFMSHLL